MTGLHYLALTIKSFNKYLFRGSITKEEWSIWRAGGASLEGVVIDCCPQDKLSKMAVLMILQLVSASLRFSVYQVEIGVLAIFYYQLTDSLYGLWH